jgi:branched-chain amino acid transport system ATP-binding protein
MKTLLDVREVDVFYDEFHAVQGASLEVREGEIVGLVGPNGHGKTTLLKAICGLLPIRRGEVEFEGESIARRQAPELVSRGIVYVAEERNLFPDMTVMENLRLGAYQKRGRERFQRNLDLVFELYPRLAERRNQEAGTLSGGEAQMAALGRGLMSAAKFMAIDEPSLGLAPNLVKDMLATIQRLSREGITILLVEQNVSALSGMAHRTYQMQEGRIVKEEIHDRGSSRATVDD